MFYLPWWRRMYRTIMRDRIFPSKAIGSRIRLYNVPLTAKPSDIRMALDGMRQVPSPVDIQLEYFSFFPTGHAILRMDSHQTARQVAPHLSSGNFFIAGNPVAAQVIPDEAEPQPFKEETEGHDNNVEAGPSKDNSATTTPLSGVGMHANLPPTLSHAIYLGGVPRAIKEPALANLINPYNPVRDEKGLCKSWMVGSVVAKDTLTQVIRPRVVQLASEDDAYRAVRDLHRSVHFLLGHPRRLYCHKIE